MLRSTSPDSSFLARSATSAFNPVFALPPIQTPGENASTSAPSVLTGTTSNNSFAILPMIKTDVLDDMIRDTYQLLDKYQQAHDDHDDEEMQKATDELLEIGKKHLAANENPLISLFKRCGLMDSYGDSRPTTPIGADV